MKFVYAVALALLAGCAGPALQESSQYGFKKGQVPSLNSPTRATVGSTVFTQFSYWSKTGLHVSSGISARVASAALIYRTVPFFM